MVQIIGTMSAWFVWSALGLYPLPGTDDYFLGSPAVDTATLRFDSGNTTHNAIAIGGLQISFGFLL